MILLDFWASWCQPCQKDVPGLRLLSVRHKDDAFLLISISVDVSEKAWEKFVASNRMDWLQTIDRDHKLGRMFNVRSLPSYFLVDAEGIIAPGEFDTLGAQIGEQLKRISKNRAKHPAAN